MEIIDYLDRIESNHGTGCGEKIYMDDSKKFFIKCGRTDVEREDGIVRDD